MIYTEVKIFTSQEGIDPLIGILTDMGIAGFAVEDARDFQEFMDRKNSYDWDYIDESLVELAQIPTSVTFYLEGTEQSSGFLTRLKERLDEWKQSGNGAYGELEIIARTVDDSDWKDRWKEYFKPVKISERIIVKPTWEEYEQSGDELVIEIDPGMAFGTGAHPTTSLCVKLLERYLEPEKDTVLDVGCGSGILAIAAALLGAKEVLAVDIDPDAVRVARENAEWNHLSSKIRVVEGDLTKGLSERADIVVANLMADLVVMLSKDITTHLKGKSIYLSSGILIEKKAEVAAAIEECGFHILDIMEEEDWCAIAAQMKHIKRL